MKMFNQVTELDAGKEKTTVVINEGNEMKNMGKQVMTGRNDSEEKEGSKVISGGEQNTEMTESLEIKRRYTDSFKEIYKISNEGNIIAQKDYVRAYLEGGVDNPKINKKAAFGLIQALAKEDPTGESDYFLAELYFGGIGTMQNLPACVDSLHESASKGFRQGLTDLALSQVIGGTSDNLSEELLSLAKHKRSMTAQILMTMLGTQAIQKEAVHKETVKINAALSAAKQSVASKKQEIIALRSELQMKQEELDCRSASRLSKKYAEIRQCESDIAEKERLLANNAVKQQRELESERLRIQQEAKDSIRFHEARHDEAEKACRKLEIDKANLRKQLHRYEQHTGYNVRHRQAA